MAQLREPVTALGTLLPYGERLLTWARTHLPAPSRQPDHPLEQAACAREDVDPALFFPDTYTSRAQIDLAARVCWGSCPVRQACLEFALATRSEHGIFGGLGPREREQLQRTAPAAQPVGSAA
jgi:WhiB family redox-sensing transcriptional regulator